MRFWAKARHGEKKTSRERLLCGSETLEGDYAETPLLMEGGECNGCMLVRAVCKRLTLEAVAFSLLGRAPASRADVPGSRPAWCDGADLGGLHWCRDPDGSEV